MKTTIYCKLTDKGVHLFYLIAGADENFLFIRVYRKGVDEYYGRGSTYWGINEVFQGI